MNDRRRPGPRADAIVEMGGRRNIRNRRSKRKGRRSVRARSRFSPAASPGMTGGSRVLACGEPRDDGVWFGPDSATLPRRLDAGVGGAAGGAVVHDLLVAGVGQVLAAPEDREGLVELVLGIEIEAGIGRQLV